MPPVRQVALLSRSQVARADHLGLEHCQHYRDNVEHRAADHHHGLRLDHRDDDDDGEDDGEGEQQLPIVPIGAEEADHEQDQVEHQRHHLVRVLTRPLELGQEIENDQDDAVVGSRGRWLVDACCSSRLKYVSRYSYLPHEQDDHQGVFDGSVETHCGVSIFWTVEHKTH